RARREPAARGAQDDGADDEAARLREAAVPARPWRRAAGNAARARPDTPSRLQEAEVEAQGQAALVANLSGHGSQAEAHEGGLEEEPDLPRRRGRLTLAARRPVPRDRRSLQPADRPLDDRARRDEGEGLARQGRAAHRGGFAPAQGQGHLGLMAELLAYLARELVDDP